MNKRLMAKEIEELLGVESSRFRFLEMHCQDFLSPSRFEIPHRYCSGDLKILDAANRLLERGISPSVLKSNLAEMLANPEWSGGVEESAAPESTSGKLIAVASGKGGVGKSNIALNLGVEFVRSGLRTVVMDADLGVANLHLMAGLKTGPTLRDVASGECGIEDTLASVSEGPDIVPGSSGVFELANLPAAKRQLLLSELEKLEARYDVILIDAAAGVAGAVLDFVVSSDFVLVVTTPENTAITDAYALIKLALERDPCCDIGVVANRVRNTKEGARTIGQISYCVKRFLNRSVHELGWIWESSDVRRAVNERSPFSICHPRSRAAIAVRKLARVLIEKGIVFSHPQQERTGFKMYAERRPPARAAMT